MKTYQTSEIRDVVLIGGPGSGKTTLAESLAFEGKVTDRRDLRVLYLHKKCYGSLFEFKVSFFAIITFFLFACVRDPVDVLDVKSSNTIDAELLLSPEEVINCFHEHQNDLRTRFDVTNDVLTLGDIVPHWNEIQYSSYGEVISMGIDMDSSYSFFF